MHNYTLIMRFAIAKATAATLLPEYAAFLIFLAWGAL
jgi:hypothetical protein